MKLALILFSIAVSTDAGCISVSSDRIVAGDLREAVPLFETLDPGTPIGFTPLPGTQRILSSRELTLIAQRHGLALSTRLIIPSVCVERAVRSISREEMHDALVAALGVPDAELELLEFSEQPAPAGRLEFQRATLAKPSSEADAPVIWRGRLLYDGGRSVMVWAKVRITVDRTVLVASEDIAVGSVIRAVAGSFLCPGHPRYRRRKLPARSPGGVFRRGARSLRSCWTKRKT